MRALLLKMNKLLSYLNLGKMMKFSSDILLTVRQDDEVFKRYFANCFRGVVVEIGANDGLTNSNSYFFEQALNWKAYCIEASPSSYKALQKNRKNCISKQVAIHESRGIQKFINLGREETKQKKFRKGQMSGLYDTWEKDQITGSPKLFKKKENNVITVQTEPLIDILREWNLKHINFMSIDVEGGELGVINSMIWNEVKVDVLTIEIDKESSKASKIREKLLNENYELVIRLEGDEIYKRRDFITGGENIC